MCSWQFYLFMLLSLYPFQIPDSHFSRLFYDLGHQRRIIMSGSYIDEVFPGYDCHSLGSCKIVITNASGICCV